jgi:hypothetical protein
MNRLSSARSMTAYCDLGPVRQYPYGPAFDLARRAERLWAFFRAGVWGAQTLSRNESKTHPG